jgi:predicted component of type VI protein secretion system
MKKVVYLAALTVLIGCSKEVKKNALELDLNLTGEMMQVNTQTVVQDETNPNNFIQKLIHWLNMVTAIKLFYQIL